MELKEECKTCVHLAKYVLVGNYICTCTNNKCTYKCAPRAVPIPPPIRERDWNKLRDMFKQRGNELKDKSS